MENTPARKVSAVAKKTTAKTPSPYTPKLANRSIQHTPSSGKNNTPYKFRTQTKKKSQASKASYQTPTKSRGLVPLNSTGSEIRAEHNCKMVNGAITTAKVFARQMHSLNRFELASIFHCKTERRKTHLNGAHSSCGGCQSAHAALSCKLNDNILQIALETLKIKKFSELEPNYQRYLTSRFNLSERQLNSPDRVRILEKKINSLSEPQKRSSFIGTSVELERAGIYDNPIDCNRFDIYLEATLRPLEDQLAEKCRTGELTPVEALIQLQDEYRRLVLVAIDHLKPDLNRLDDLQEAWDDMIAKQQSDDFKSYLPAVDRYLKAFKARFKDRLSGTPRLTVLKKYLVDTQPRYVLNELRNNKSRDYFELSEHHLQIPTDSAAQFLAARESIERRLTEAYFQLDGLYNTPADIERLLKYSYGKKDKDGVMQLPDKERIGEVFCSVFPSRKN